MTTRIATINVTACDDCPWNCEGESCEQLFREFTDDEHEELHTHTGWFPTWCPLPESGWRKPPDDKLITEYATTCGASSVWKSWLDHMTSQNRPVRPELQTWPIPLQDAELDAGIARDVIGDFLTWAKDHSDLTLQPCDWHKPPDLPQDGEWIVVLCETDDPSYQWGGLYRWGRDIDIDGLDPDYDWWRPLGELPPGVTP